MKNFLKIVAVLFLVGAGIALYTQYSNGLLRSPVYDSVAPVIPEINSPAVLVLSKTNGFIHKDGIPAASAMLRDLAATHGWNLFETDSAASHNAVDLARFDVVIWNNTSGDILTPEQRADFRAWLESGGRWLGLHAAGGDFSYDWKWYVDSLLGAQFIGHTMSPQFQDADVLVVEPSAMTDHLATPWRIPQEEWYGFDRNPRQTGSTILLALDESSYDTEELFFPDSNMPDEHPIAWMHAIGQGTAIYLAIGHTASTYSVPEFRELVAKAVSHLLMDTGE